MASTAFVCARIDKKLKDEASEALAEFGLTVSDIVRMTPHELRTRARATGAKRHLPHQGGYYDAMRGSDGGVTDGFRT